MNSIRWPPFSLEQFVTKIEGFNSLSASSKIDYFVCYLTVIKDLEGAKPKEIEVCFDELKIQKYSNVSHYVSSNSKKVRGKDQKYILKRVFIIWCELKKQRLMLLPIPCVQW